MSIWLTKHKRSLAASSLTQTVARSQFWISKRSSRNLTVSINGDFVAKRGHHRFIWCHIVYMGLGFYHFVHFLCQWACWEAVAAGNRWAEKFLLRETGDSPTPRTNRGRKTLEWYSFHFLLDLFPSRWSLVSCTFAPQGREQFCTEPCKVGWFRKRM